MPAPASQANASGAGQARSVQGYYVQRAIGEALLLLVDRLAADQAEQGRR
jgi:hypothetical protein